MVRYHHHNLNLTKSQAKTLLTGGRIKLNSDCLKEGEIGIHISSRQRDKLLKSRKLKRGTTLQLSNQQIQHNFRHGTGIWRELMGKLLKQQLKQSSDKTDNTKDFSSSDDEKSRHSSNDSDDDSSDSSVSEDKLPLVPGNSHSSSHK